MAWQRNGTPDTLVAPGPDAEITDMTEKIFNQILIYELFSITAAVDFTFNANSNSVYTTRVSSNGTADTTVTNQTFIDMRFNSNEDHFVIINVCSISGEEKLTIQNIIARGVAGAANAPNRVEQVSKFVPSPLTNGITQVKINKGSFSNYATDTNISALGTD